jgi:aspartyl-tRNA(Asn)/glutamyl-tRNA(Gln) amidotransferase subunit B
VESLGVTSEQIAGIIKLRSCKSIGSSAADTLFGLLCDSDLEAAALADEQGLLQVTDAAEIDAWVKEAIGAQPQAADDVRGGKDAAIGRLVGEVMKRSGGSADASAVRDLLLATLRK